MGRYPRPNLPGAAFHLTARAQNRAHLFVPGLRDRIVWLLRRHVARCDTQLVAYVIMSNHLHLVVLQGHQPLSSLMQPLLRSIALATHAAHGTEGHVFERRYHDRWCRGEAHLRNAIAYTHANPVRAGMCADPADYEWSSHRAYLAGCRTPAQPPIDLARGLDVFATLDPHSNRSARPAYADFLANILNYQKEDARPDLRAEQDGSFVTPHSAEHERGLSDARPRMLEIARRVMQRHGMNESADILKSRWGRRSRLAVRGEVAAAASLAGYTGREIAAFLKVSEPTVSRMLADASPTRTA